MINQKLIQRLDSSIVSNFMDKINKQKKSEPEQFINQSGNFRVRNVQEEKEKPKRFDALSTATSNFYKEQSDTQTPLSKRPPSLGGSKLLDSNKVAALKQNMSTRIQSSQPTRPLLIKRVVKEQIQQTPQIEATKGQILGQFLKRMSSAKQEDKPVTPSLDTSQVEQKPIRRMSQLSQRKQEPIKAQIFQKAPPRTAMLPQRKIVKENDHIYEVMDVDTIKDITQEEEEQFEQVLKIQFRFNTQSDSLYMLGEFLPNLQELKLNNSQIESLRLLGTRLRNLRILWISKSKLNDISGITSMPNLIELYCSFNNIKDISPLAFHENIAILDIEGNELADEMQIEYLESLKLQQLVISSNPLVYNNNFRSLLFEKLPHTEIIIEDTAQIKQLEPQVDTSDQLQQLYDIAQYLDDNLDVIHVEDLVFMEKKIRNELSELDEPDEDRLLSIKIKQHPIEQPKQTRPQSAFIQNTKQQQEKVYEPDPFSDLLSGETLVGNPIKAAKLKKNQQQRNNDLYDPLDRKSLNIQNLMNKFQ
ncbi:hypothetical protein pb186bvf_017826 [Paramecium bursaria]